METSGSKKLFTKKSSAFFMARFSTSKWIKATALFPTASISANYPKSAGWIFVSFDYWYQITLWEQHRNMYIIKCETDRQSRLDAWDKCSGLVHWDDPEGWDGEGGGRGVQDGEHMWIHGWFMSMYGKNHYNTVK